MTRWPDPHQLVRAAVATGDHTELLVYADWLASEGHTARAELVHLQCERAQLAAWERKAAEIDDEIAWLLAEHGEALRGDLPALDGVTWGDFACGHVAVARVRDLACLGAAAATLADHTAVTRVELAARTGELDDDAPLAWLRCLRAARSPATADRLWSTPAELELDDVGADLGGLGRDHGATPLVRLSLTHGDAGEELTRLLGRVPWSRQLETLEIPTVFSDDNSGYQADPRLGADGTKPLAKLKALRRLDIDRQRVGGVALGKLVAALPELRSLSARENLVRKIAFGPGPSLVDLDLSRNALGADGLRAIAKGERTAALERLVLDTCEIESLGLAELSKSPSWHTLRRLDLSRNPLGASAVRALAAAPPPKQLHALALADADLDETGGEALAKVSWLGRLSELDLSGNILRRGGGALRTIERSRGTAPEAMRRLALASCGLERTEAVAISRFWPFLVELDLSGNPITDAGLERFAAMKPAPALQRLALRDCQLTGDGVELLARARTPRLRALDLSGNTLGAAVVPLLAAPSLRALETLALRRCGVPAIAALTRATALPPRLATLDVREVELDEAALLALADAPHLRAIRRLRLDGNPFVFAEATRARLEQRFGPMWHQDRT
ncbi:MAG: TIGR02996 domain-containing protein [Deltaproteobacteria bacterium]|nr:TIGR02996 domain-containing protein [Deltaproteobacteria bacterium]